MGIASLPLIYATLLVPALAIGSIYAFTRTRLLPADDEFVSALFYIVAGAGLSFGAVLIWLNGLDAVFRPGIAVAAIPPMLATLFSVLLVERPWRARQTEK